MKAKYFYDTDTLLLQFSDAEIAETYDLTMRTCLSKSIRKVVSCL